MKKIHLSIPKPCHEDWDAMTPSDKGRFCASCQKTVVDFTNMSDRQLVEFFKGPPSSVCGRVYNDQLNRDIVLPKKRIPWVKYFFQITWPAFVLFLKSCGVKENVQGKVKVESSTPDVQEHSVATLGMMMPAIAPVDTGVVAKEEFVKGEIMGDVEITPLPDTVEMPVDTLDIDTAIAYKPMDTVMIVAYPSTQCRVTMGAVSVIRTVTETKYKSADKKNPVSPDFKVYPNPVQAGSLMTISFEGSDDFPEMIQILSASGQLVSQIKQNENEHATVIHIQIPSNVAAGIYFLQMINKEKQVKATKIIVTK